MTENQQQIALIQWCNLIGVKEFYHRMNGKFPIAHFNNNSASDGIGAHKKKMGVFRGIPDLFIPIKSSGFSGLFIELKDGVKKARPDQIACMDFLTGQGFKCAVCYSAKHAVETIRDYLNH